jgi:hypothetical protein
MKKAKQFSDAEVALAVRSRRQAEAERSRVTSDRLAATITTFIEWRAFAYWIRLLAEREGSSSPRVQRALEDRCRGFPEGADSVRRANCEAETALWLRLIEWIDTCIFSDARSEGWQHALGYYAARDDRLDRIRKYWLKCHEQSAIERPCTVLPEYHEWFCAASEPS